MYTICRYRRQTELYEVAWFSASTSPLLVLAGVGLFWRVQFQLHHACINSNCPFQFQLHHARVHFQLPISIPTASCPRSLPTAHFNSNCIMPACTSNCPFQFQLYHARVQFQLHHARVQFQVHHTRVQFQLPKRRYQWPPTTRTKVNLVSNDLSCLLITKRLYSNIAPHKWQQSPRGDPDNSQPETGNENLLSLCFHPSLFESSLKKPNALSIKMRSCIEGKYQVSRIKLPKADFWQRSVY
jgi:hypothetical protein